jgi:hypothetical protein
MGLSSLGLSRRAWTIVGVVAGVLVALGIGSLFLLVLVAGGNSSPAQKPPVAASVSRCLVSQLTVTPGEAGAAAGSIGQVAHFENVSHTACTLYGYPGMQLLGAAGEPLATEVHRGASSTVPARAVRAVDLLPGKQASFDLGYADATGYGNEHCPTSTRVEVTPPNDYGHLTIAWKLQPYGGDIPHLECGEIAVSPVFAG